MLLISAVLGLCAQNHPIQGQTTDTIRMKVDTLKPAIITAILRPRLKGDTVEYVTENIQSRPNALVEELLGRLPGLAVDAFGNITYNGEKIQHLLVDGEDIFGSDPTMITRNFDAKKIARVQILDRRSDQSIFTGVDDGTRIKTMNLVLKENAKNSYFGRVETGGNPKSYYNFNGVLAAFQGKEQFTVFGLASNTGVTGFTSNTGGSAAGIISLNGNADALDASAGTGIPHVDALAIHYANSWNGVDDHAAANYQYSHYYTQPATTTKTIQAEENSVYGQYQQSRSVNWLDQHWIYAIYDWNAATHSRFRLNVYGTNSKGENQLEAIGGSTFNDILVNNSQRTIRDKVSQQNVGGSISWRAQIGNRSDRALSITTGLSKKDNSTNGYLFAIDRFYQPNGYIQSLDTVDERKRIASNSIEIGNNLNFTEPLWKWATLGLSYGLHYSADKPIQASFNLGDGKYQQRIDSLSSSFKTRTINQRATFTLQGKTYHFNYTIGFGWQSSNYHQVGLSSDSTLYLHAFNFTPSILVNLKLSNSANLNFQYDASQEGISPAQLQPIKKNSDPLHITIGNPDLRPPFDQNFKLEFRQIKTWIFNFRISLSLISNSISTKVITDTLGRQISEPVNIDGTHYAALNFSVNRKVLGLDAGLHIVSTYARSLNYTNVDLSRNDAYTGGGGFSLNKYVPDKYSLLLNSNFTYFNQSSSVNQAADIRYWAQSHLGSVTIFFLKDYELNTNGTYTWQQKTASFGVNTSVLLWNAYVSRNFLRNKLVVKFQFNNILGNNSGITRTNYANQNTESTTNILGRNWMVSAIYHFDKKFKENKLF